MTEHEFDLLINEAATEVGDCRSYSGRGMYGAECLGVVTDNEIGAVLDIVSNLLSLTDLDCVIEAIQKMKENPKYDSMGMNRIVYFPNIPFIPQ